MTRKRTNGSEHGWFDKRFIYEESFQMPLMIRAPKLIQPGSICNEVVSNVDFAATWLEYAGLRIPTYMQGDSFLPALQGKPNANPDQVAYHRYWMHRDDIHNAYVSSIPSPPLELGSRATLTYLSGSLRDPRKALQVDLLVCRGLRIGRNQAGGRGAGMGAL